ncbi:CinA family protein [Rhizobium sp. L1K21]|uniref:CinA family protein n=1 Tax=Rhizobium sp. L1K21 TaxID=2954933 RepID=UPI0020925102|nr:CinA family protein [Rhizobium sp. L1K21]MCO6185935.1 CinA family protein [Rhizobium sp. L1K21]
MSNSGEVMELARQLLDICRKRNIMIATAESCTGGLLAAALTELPGSSDVFERGFVTYSNDAKIELLGIFPITLKQHGAVSEETAMEMAHCALVRSEAGLAVGITGIAGPGGGTADKPVGLVHIVAKRYDGHTLHRELQLGDIGRSAVRMESVKNALEMLLKLATAPAEH